MPDFFIFLKYFRREVLKNLRLVFEHHLIPSHLLSLFPKNRMVIVYWLPHHIGVRYINRFTTKLAIRTSAHGFMINSLIHYWCVLGCSSDMINVCTGQVIVILISPHFWFNVQLKWRSTGSSCFDFVVRVPFVRVFAFACQTVCIMYSTFVSFDLAVFGTFILFPKFQTYIMW